MPGRAAGNYIDLADRFYFFLRDSHRSKIDGSVFEHRIQSILYGAGLFMDLFHHEMLESAFFCRLGIPLDLGGLFLNLFPIQIEEAGFSRCEPGKLQIADIINVSCIFQNGRDIGSHIGLTLGDPDDHGAVFTRHPDLSRIVFKHQTQGIGTAHTYHGLGNGIHGTHFIFFVIVIHQLDDYFGISLTVEGVAMLQQFFFQFHIIFNNPVMDTHNLRFHRAGTGAGAVAGNMWMCIDLAGFPMGGPAGMSQAAGPGQSLAAICFFHQIGQTPFGLYDLCHLLAVTYGKACRVIPSVFQF